MYIYYSNVVLMSFFFLLIFFKTIQREREGFFRDSGFSCKILEAISTLYHILCLSTFFFSVINISLGILAIKCMYIYIYFYMYNFIRYFLIF